MVRTRFALITAATLVALLLPISPAVLAAGSADYIVVLKDATTAPAAVAREHGKRYRSR